MFLVRSIGKPVVPLWIQQVSHAFIRKLKMVVCRAPAYRPASRVVGIAVCVSVIAISYSIGHAVVGVVVCVLDVAIKWFCLVLS